MNKTIAKTRGVEKKKLISIAEKLIEKVNDSGLKQGYIAKEIKVSEPTFSKFMNLKEEYVTKRICDALNDFFKK